MVLFVLVVTPLIPVLTSAIGDNRLGARFGNWERKDKRHGPQTRHFVFGHWWHLWKVGQTSKGLYRVGFLHFSVTWWKWSSGLKSIPWNQYVHVKTNPKCLYRKLVSSFRSQQMWEIQQRKAGLVQGSDAVRQGPVPSISRGVWSLWAARRYQLVSVKIPALRGANLDSHPGSWALPARRPHPGLSSPLSPVPAPRCPRRGSVPGRRGGGGSGGLQVVLLSREGSALPGKAWQESERGPWEMCALIQQQVCKARKLREGGSSSRAEVFYPSPV